MVPPDKAAVGNALIARLPAVMRARFLAGCDEAVLAVDDVLADAGAPYRHVHFPGAGMIGLLAGVPGHAPLEVALVGREGMDGAMLVFGEARSATRSVVLAAGHAWRMEARRFREELEASLVLRRLAGRAAFAVFSQVVRAVPCTRFHPLVSRLALWLLRAHDRMGDAGLSFTHQRLAELLGVQRSAVTLAAGHLFRGGAIRYARGDVRILDRGRLAGWVCPCGEDGGWHRRP